MAQRMKEPSITDPPLLLDQFVMHDGDVSPAPPKLIHPSLNQNRSASLERWSLHRRDRVVVSYPGI